VGVPEWYWGRTLESIPTDNPSVAEMRRALTKYLEVRQWTTGKGLYIFGDSECYKTYGVCALAQAIIHTSLETSVRFVRWFELLDLAGRKEDDHAYWVMETLRGCDVLIVDDVGSEPVTAREQAYVHRTLFRLVDQRGSDVKATIYTSNFDLDHLSALLDAVRAMDEGDEEMARPIPKIANRIRRTCAEIGVREVRP